MRPVILSGGSGTRLWPVSRSGYPKQFCPLFDEPLEVSTMKRLSRWGALTVIGHRTLKTLSHRLSKEHRIQDVEFIGEPRGRDTAPAIALACRLAELKGSLNEVIGIFPSDHLIRKEKIFADSVDQAAKLAEAGFVVTLGIRPSYPSTGYGYIQTAAGGAGGSDLPVLKFHEKPAKTRAEEYVAAGSFFWNAGIFIFRVKDMISHFQKLQPELWKTVQKLGADLGNIDSVYEEIKPVSFDYAIMEKLDSKIIRCIPFDPDWNDVGSWDAVADEAGKSNIRATPKQESLFLEGSEGNYLHAQDEKVYGFLGVQDLIVVDTPDALLITKKGRSQDVKPLVDKIKERRPEKVRDHLFEFRPWGTFEIVKNGDNFKSKLIEVNPGHRISYQSHKHREEHWVMIEGEGVVTLNEEKHSMKKGSYIKIPQGTKHRIENTGTGPLRFIEVQLGTYFGEDDITRYQDDYDRR